MKKPLITFLVVFVLAFGILATVEIQKIDTNVAIAKSPAFVLAAVEGITKKTKKSRETFQVNYSYAVAGTTYKLDTEWLDTVAEAEALAGTAVQIAYATTAPAHGVFKSDFDKRDPKEGIASALVSAAGFGLLGAIIGTLALLWQFPWLRRG